MCSLNASECCRTIGCNCAGTQSMEFLTNFPRYEWLILLTLIVASTLLLIGYLYAKKKEKKKKC